MWVCLSLLSALCLLPGGGAESQGGGPRCQPAPDWKIGEVTPMKEAEGRVTVVALLQASWLFCLVQASKMDSLRQKLEGQGLMNINYMVVNDQNMQAQRLHPLLTTRLSSNIQLYKQGDQDANVWHALKGEKDDFLVYDRCGRLTYHISLPYSIIGQGHVETAIKDTYCKRICGNCSHESVDVPEECSRPVEARPEEAAAAAAAGGAGTRVEEEAGHGDGHGRGHHAHDHGHHHGHHGHGDQQGVAHGQHHGNGNHHGDRGQHQHDVSQQRPADDADFLLLLSGDQRAVAPGPQEVQGAAVMRRPWAAGKAMWKSKHSWRLAAASGNEAAVRSSWCWHWRRLFAGDAGEETLVGSWHCDEALPASWQWRAPTGDAADHATETWQWRTPPADWQLPQPAQWAWPPGVVSWGWQQM